MNNNSNKMEDGTGGNTKGSVPESDNNTIFKKHKIEHVYNVLLSYFNVLINREKVIYA